MMMMRCVIFIWFILGSHLADPGGTQTPRFLWPSVIFALLGAPLAVTFLPWQAWSRRLGPPLVYFFWNNSSKLQSVPWLGPPVFNFHISLSVCGSWLRSRNYSTQTRTPNIPNPAGANAPPPPPPNPHATRRENSPSFVVKSDPDPGCATRTTVLPPTCSENPYIPGAHTHTHTHTHPSPTQRIHSLRCSFAGF